MRGMKVEINHKEVELEPGCNTLAQLMQAMGFTGAGQAAAVDNKLVPKAQWESFALADGQKITVICAVCGG